jgi:nicotinamide mononucleotide transporter
MHWFVTFLDRLGLQWPELLAVLSGFAYLYCTIKQYIWLWVWGTISSLLYVYVFYSSVFYAGSVLQFYYVCISIYGYWFWYKNRHNSDKEDDRLKVSHAGSTRLAVFVMVITALTIITGFFLKKFTNSVVPFSDAFTFAGGMIATWMLTRKFIEHWLFWIVIDSFSTILYFRQKLHLTAILYFVYLVMAIVGYFQWKKSILEHDEC